MQNLEIQVGIFRKQFTNFFLSFYSLHLHQNSNLAVSDDDESRIIQMLMHIAQMTGRNLHFIYLKLGYFDP